MIGDTHRLSMTNLSVLESFRTWWHEVCTGCRQRVAKCAWHAACLAGFGASLQRPLRSWGPTGCTAQVWRWNLYIKTITPPRKTGPTVSHVQGVEFEPVKTTWFPKRKWFLQSERTIIGTSKGWFVWSPKRRCVQLSPGARWTAGEYRERHGASFGQHRPMGQVWELPSRFRYCWWTKSQTTTWDG